MAKTEFGPVLAVPEVNQSQLDAVCQTRIDEFIKAYNLQPKLEALTQISPKIADLSQYMVMFRADGFPVMRWQYSIPVQVPDLRVVSGTVYSGSQSEPAVFGSWYKSKGNRTETFAFNIYLKPLIEVGDDFRLWWQTKHPNEELKVYYSDKSTGSLVKGVTDQAVEVITFCDRQYSLDLPNPYSDEGNPWSFLNLHPEARDRAEANRFLIRIKRSMTGYLTAIDSYVKQQESRVGRQVWG